ncbi:MAG: hypothetical protein DWQ08_15105 [Proteobacteria bacterium]|nr:MAG: hypothetical protein DWQ08_15105 [Pseudomonadota bacterium]
MSIRYRGLWAFFFVIGAMLCGLAAGTAVGGAWFVPAGSGLAGPLIALGYGIVGAALAGGAALIPALKMRGPGFVYLAAPVIVAGIVIAGGVAWKVSQSNAERDAYLDRQRAALPPFSLEIDYLAEWEDMPFIAFSFDSEAGAFSVKRADGTACKGAIEPTGEEKVTLLAAMRHVEVLLATDANPCGAQETPMARLAFRITEHTAPSTSGEIGVTLACMQRHAEIADLLGSAEAVYRQLSDRCE